MQRKRDMVNVMAKEHSMVIRSATEKDLDRVLEIDRLSFPAPWTHHCFKLVLKDFFFVIEQKVLVIEQNEIIGYIVVCLCDLGLRAEILRIAVHPDHRGKGIAKALIETCLQTFSKENIQSVELEVNTANRSAVKLYEKFGFKIKRIATFMADQDFHIFYVMKLKLRDPEKVTYQVPKKYYHVGDYYDLQIAA
jgi:ribosomal-protein-alanine N-acetyltransferase